MAGDSGGNGSGPKDLAGICGIYWEGNAWYDVLKGTCATQEEAGLNKICPIYACARERGVTQCGLCSEFPCALLINLAAESGPDDIRIESAAKRAELGEEQWMEWARARKIWTRALCPLRTHLPPARNPARVGAGS